MDTKEYYKSIHLLLICISILILHQSFTFGSMSSGNHAKVLCITKEREALLEFKRGLIDEYDLLSSWRNEEANEECCSWWGVKCRNTTGHILVLNLRGNMFTYLTGNISSSLVKLQYLKYLDLSSNNFGGQIPKFIGYFKRLEYLNLSSEASSNGFTGPIPPQLRNLTYLRALDLGGNFLIVKSLEWLSHLVYLEYLDLSESNVEPKNWLHEITKLPNLRELQLSSCVLPIVIPSSLFLANISSARLSSLDFSFNVYQTTLYSWLFNFSSLTSLDLTGNDLGQIASGFGYLESLEHLNLYGNHIQGGIPKSFGNLSHLCSLDVGNNNLSQPFSELLNILSGSTKSLEYLFFQDNALTGSLINLTRFSSLRELRLQDNFLNGIFHESFRQISSLEYLDLSGNQMTGPLPDLALFPSLRELYLRSNHFHGMIPHGLGQLSKLKILDVSFNRLQGLPESLGQLYNLEIFLAPSNLLEGTISESHLFNLCNLKKLDLSSNYLTWNVSLDWIPCFQLQVISLSSCNLGPHFPKWLQAQNNYSYLDISLASISDTMPSWFSDFPSMLTHLNLSYNQISGMIYDLSANNIDFNYGPIVIDFSYNNFSGPLPRFPRFVSELRVNNNQFSGSINSICKILSAITLDLSENLLSGEIPDCWITMPELLVLNVANNIISGSIPDSLCSSASLNSLYVRNNNLSGQFPASLKNCLALKVLDLGRNTLSGKIPEWIGTKLAYLGILSLRFNKFSGSIPPSICQLQSIQILDLSGNHLSGRIPQCFSNFIALQLLYDGSSVSYDFDPTIARGLIAYHGNAFVQWKNKESEYKNTLWLLKTIDLSSNELVGDIPKDFSRMNALLSLNLSRNHLTGKIIEGIGTMKMLEVLDLSRNQLSGKIPIGLANLTFLSVLDLSNNNFSGRIPSSTQLQGFDSSTYGGNIQLCGRPLPQCPTFAPPNPHVGYDSNVSTSQENDDDFPSKEFYISMALGFIVAFWGVLGPIFFLESWRNAYFKRLDGVDNWFHLSSALCFARLKAKLRA
ncbi:receptor-like protein EIX1 [Nicotiana sylvestris]|uniref:LRR receptor-like serine/threonine-protein kinase FLS2 n=1 Tax=Nicotiana sylvestris TaxID=4096 RepID=A0A1U7V3H5_NICSY|nr:PREDICTED: LRR receptor-like serine/threonine-protein kinase FLS2 [Nicotiana sylvestris]